MIRRLLNILFGFRSRVTIVKNRNRQFGADTHYLRVRATGVSGERVSLLLTEEQYASAIFRATQNPEDR